MAVEELNLCYYYYYYYYYRQVLGNACGGWWWWCIPNAIVSSFAERTRPTNGNIFILFMLPTPIHILLLLRLYDYQTPA